MPMPSPLPLLSPPPPQDNIMFEITELTELTGEASYKTPNVCLLVNISRYTDIVCVSFKVILVINIK